MAGDYPDMVVGCTGGGSNFAGIAFPFLGAKLRGDRDLAFRQGERQRFEQVFQNSKTFILQGAGHFIQEDAPDRIVEEFRLWWQEGQKSGI
jgi:tryptophan synthase beta subunit